MIDEDAGLSEPNLNLEPKVIEGAVKAVADLYSTEINMTDYGTTQVPQRIKMNEELQNRVWRDVARRFPHLEVQILGLRVALRRAREIENHLPAEKIDEISKPLTKGIEFKDERTKFFIQDIFFRRVMWDKDFAEINPSDIFRRAEAISIREDLGLKAGLCDLTLEQVVKEAIVGTLRLTSRQTKVS